MKRERASSSARSSKGVACSTAGALSLSFSGTLFFAERRRTGSFEVSRAGG